MHQILKTLIFFFKYISRNADNIKENILLFGGVFMMEKCRKKYSNKVYQGAEIAKET